MIIREYKKLVLREDLVKTSIRAMNGFLGMSSQQVDILAAGINRMLGGRIFEKGVRGSICDSLGISRHNLNNYIKALKGKGIIIDGGGFYNLHSGLPLNGFTDNCEIKFIIEVVDET